jgi:hypothetical protein
MKLIISTTKTILLRAVLLTALAFNSRINSFSQTFIGLGISVQKYKITYTKSDLINQSGSKFTPGLNFSILYYLKPNLSLGIQLSNYYIKTYSQANYDFNDAKNTPMRCENESPFPHLNATIDYTLINNNKFEFSILGNIGVIGREPEIEFGFVGQSFDSLYTINSNGITHELVTYQFGIGCCFRYSLGKRWLVTLSENYFFNTGHHLTTFSMHSKDMRNNETRGVGFYTNGANNRIGLSLGYRISKK